MRISVAAMALAFMLGTAAAAFGQAPPMGHIMPERGAGASAQPQVPPAQQPDNASPRTNASSNAMPEQLVPTSGFSEPDLKTPKSVNGKSSSYLIKDAPLPGDYVMGKTTAPITIVEYASLSCPHCAHFSNAVLPAIEKNYIDTGKVRYILRMFPLNEPALKGGMLLYCAAEQDKSKYYTFAKVLFDAQSKWAFDSNYESELQTIAEVGGISKEKFQHCMKDTALEMKVLKEKKVATDELAVPHTPYIFINGKVYDGPHTVEAVSGVIDQQLAQVKRR